MQPVQNRFNLRFHRSVVRGVMVIGVVLILFPSGCTTQPPVSIEASMNVWLGKSKDERIKAVGWPTRCTRSKDQDETCVWVRRGSSPRDFDCPPDGRLAGQPCHTDSKQLTEHHLSFVYNREGIARAWTYRGSEGERASAVAIHRTAHSSLGE